LRGWSGLDSRENGECKDDTDNGEMKYNRRDDDQDFKQRECGARKLC